MTKDLCNLIALMCVDWGLSFGCQSPISYKLPLGYTFIRLEINIIKGNKMSSLWKLLISKRHFHSFNTLYILLIIIFIIFNILRGFRDMFLNIMLDIIYKPYLFSQTFSLPNMFFSFSTLFLYSTWTLFVSLGNFLTITSSVISSLTTSLSSLLISSLTNSSSLRSSLTSSVTSLLISSLTSL